MWISLERETLAVIFLYYNPVRRIFLEANFIKKPKSAKILSTPLKIDEGWVEI